MSKLSQEMIDKIPGLRAAQRNDNIVFLNLDTEDTNPVITEGFHDDQIQEMSEGKLKAQLDQITAEEQHLLAMQQDLNKRRNATLNILKRKAELQNGVHN